MVPVIVRVVRPRPTRPARQRVRAAGGRRRAAIAAVVAVVVAVAVPVGVAGAASSNLVPNASVESPAGSRPASWSAIGSGSNHRTFAYLYNGAQSGHRFVRAMIDRFGTGSAGWTFAPVPVRPGTAYTFSDWSRGNAATVVQARVTTASGKVRYLVLGTAPAGRAWHRSTFSFRAPAGAVRLTVQHLLVSVGTLDVDSARLVLGVSVASPSSTAAQPTPAPTPRPTPVPTPAPTPRPAGTALVSLTFDDGLISAYTSAFPVLKQNGLPGTFYLVSSILNSGPNYLNTAQGRQMLAAGEELGSHTVTHRNLTTLSPGELTAELANSKATLEALFGPIRSMAYPFGSTNDAVTAQAGRYYESARTTIGGLNLRGGYDPLRLRMHYVTADISASTVAGWMQEAAQAGAWTILVYHAVSDDGGVTTVTPETFAAQLAAVRASGVRAVTVSTGISLTR